MIEITTMTAQSTLLGSASGMPAYGQTSFEAAAISAFAGVPAATCARVRKGHTGLAATTGDAMGTTAWRPPIC
jgi:hypothetical protein